MKKRARLNVEKLSKKYRKADPSILEPPQKARKGTSERKLGATYRANMHQIMRDVLRGALMENLEAMPSLCSLKEMA